MISNKIVRIGVAIGLCIIVFKDIPNKIDIIYSKYNLCRRIREGSIEVELRNWLGKYTDEFLRHSFINRFSPEEKQLILSNLIELFESNFDKLRSYFLEVSDSLSEEKRKPKEELEKMAKNYIKDNIAPVLMEIIAEKDEVEELVLFMKESVKLNKEAKTSLVFGGLGLFNRIISRIHNRADLKKEFRTVIDLVEESKDMADMAIAILNTIHDLFYYDVDGFIENSRFSLKIIDGFEKLGKKYYRPLICAISVLYPYSKAIRTMDEFKSSSLLLKKLYTVLSQNGIDNIEILKLHYREDEANPYYEFRTLYIDNPVSSIFSDLTVSIDSAEEFEEAIKSAIGIVKQGKDPTPYLNSFITRD